jgi:xanthine dehydrogenase accessory factor
MTRWIAELARLAEAGTPAVLVTVLRAEGSSPREAGAKMVVTREALHGSVGGGHLELTAVEIARDLLAAPDAGQAVGPLQREFPLGPSLGQCCGGAVTLVFELLAPARWRVALFGAGHVGRALVRLLGELACRVTWIDERPEAFPAALPVNVEAVVAEAPEDEVARLPAGADVLIMTHSHPLDQRIVEAALRRPELRSVGLIGSGTKRARFLARLAQRGFPPEAQARLTCPVGLPGVGGKRPAEIAIAVAAQLLQLEAASVRLATSQTTSPAATKAAPAAQTPGQPQAAQARAPDQVPAAPPAK